jgi:hypothetical protein
VASTTTAAPRSSRLDVPEEVGDFPCIEVHSPEALTHHIVTVFTADADADGPAPDMEALESNGTWTVRAGDLEAVIQATSHEPEIQIL